MFGNLGAPEVLLIIFAILILFGAKRIPELARGLGQGMKEFKKALQDVQEDIKMDSTDEKTDAEKDKEVKS